MNRVEITMPTPQPFRLDLTALALVRRPNNLLDTWQGGVYRRVVPANSIGETRQQFLLEVSDPSAPFAERSQETPTGQMTPAGPDGYTHKLKVSATGYLNPDVLAAAAQGAVTHMFGLDVDLAPFEKLAESDDMLAPLARQLRGLRPPRYPSLFQALLNAVPCQQVTLVFGLQLIERMCRAFGPDMPFAPVSSQSGPLPMPHAQTLRQLDHQQLTTLGLSNTKARTLIGLADAFTDGSVDPAELATAQSKVVSSTLQGLYGIGRWTAEYALLRGLGRLDVYPYGDSGARNSLAKFLQQDGKPDYEWVADAVAGWQPYAGFVYLHLLVAGMLKSDNFGSVPWSKAD